MRQPRPPSYDVYLGSSGSGSDKDWMYQIAIPLLDKKHLSHVDDGMFGEWEERITAMAHCSTVFFHIASPYSSLSGFVQLAYFIGRGWNVVGSLCASPHILLADAPWCKEEVEESLGSVSPRTRHRISLMMRNDALDRGVAYLKDIAKRNRVPLYLDLREGLRSVIRDHLVS